MAGEAAVVVLELLDDVDLLELPRRRRLTRCENKCTGDRELLEELLRASCCATREVVIVVLGGLAMGKVGANAVVSLDLFAGGSTGLAHSVVAVAATLALLSMLMAEAWRESHAVRASSGVLRSVPPKRGCLPVVHLHPWWAFTNEALSKTVVPSLSSSWMGSGRHGGPGAEQVLVASAFCAPGSAQPDDVAPGADQGWRLVKTFAFCAPGSAHPEKFAPGADQGWQLVKTSAFCAPGSAHAE